jgi:hypothetical protein
MKKIILAVGLSVWVVQAQADIIPFDLFGKARSAERQ